MYSTLKGARNVVKNGRKKLVLTMYLEVSAVLPIMHGVIQNVTRRMPGLPADDDRR